MAHYKRIAKVGNSYAIRLDKTLLEILNITEDTPLRIDVNTANGNQIVITPVTKEDEEFEEAFAKAYGELKPVLNRMPDLPKKKSTALVEKRNAAEVKLSLKD